MGRRFLAIGVMVVLFGGSVAGQQRVLVPPEVQLALFRKIWTLDRNFPRQATTTVAILYQRLYRESYVAKEEILNAGRNVPGLQFVTIDIDAAGPDERQFDHVDVVYLAPLRAVELAALLARTRARAIRSVTGVPEYVARGVAVGITVERNRPVILINLEAARTEGADFSSQLLKLARVVR